MVAVVARTLRLESENIGLNLGTLTLKSFVTLVKFQMNLFPYL